jgi:ribosomal protein S18 acetylase RimI-like enzyme
MWPVGAVAPGSTGSAGRRSHACEHRPVVEFRDATPADAPAIAEVQVAAWRVAYRGLLPDAVLAALSVPEGTRRWDEILSAAAPRTGTVLVVAGEAVLGFAATGPADGTVGRLYAIYLDPALVGTGLGHRLHTAAVGRLRAAGFTAAELWVLHDNARALRFYRREGWVDTGRTQVEIGPGGDERLERLMRLALG